MKKAKKIVKKTTNKVVVDKHPICERLRRIRVGRQISYVELVELSGITRAALWKIMEGSTICPKFSTVEKIVIALDAAWMPIVEQAEERPANVVRARFRR